MALWSKNDFFVLTDCTGLLKPAEVCAIQQSDGDNEHTQKKKTYQKRTHICEKIGLCYVTAKILQWRGKTKTLENARSKKIPARKTSNRRCSNNAQRRKITRK